MEAPARSIVAPSSVSPGRPYPLGATWDGAGVNFALYSEHAERVELCLFDPKGRREIERLDLESRTDFVWHCYLPDARPGLLYAYRVHGPNAPERGHRFDPAKLLLDPYARLVKGKISAGLGRSQVIDPAFTWGDDRPPRTPWQDTVIYELHVKGFTQLHPEVPEQLRGTYAGLATAPVINHLKRLGVTAVELLPIHAFGDERRLLQHGLRNYWGYNSIGFFAPELRYSATGTLGEFKTLVKTLHAAGLELILDVVYNHTAESDHTGPTLSFRGIDNAVYYWLDPHNARRYLNFTGTGNSFNTTHPAALALVLDSLRYWVTEMHVDGFRFDLATTLARGPHGFERRSAFLSAVAQDPVLSQVKLIAEPWDLGEGGYQLGQFAPRWSEWNDKYRDAVRGYWKGDEGMLGELAARLSGSRDLFAPSGRGPAASINFVSTHDGFTLHDLVSYERKHNEANLEGNRDGTDHNRSWNCGVEGSTDDPQVNALRERQKRNLLATLFFSQGVPMIAAGDELGRSQLGNNNAYCQDSELSWVDWRLDDERRALLEFVRELVQLRRGQAIFRQRQFPEPQQLRWLTPHGGEMSEADWRLPFARCVGMHMLEKDLLLLLNAHHDAIGFVLPRARLPYWAVLLDTASQEQAAFLPGNAYPLQPRSLALLQAKPSTSGPARTGA